MCDRCNKHYRVSSTALLLLAAALGMLTGWLDFPVINNICEVITDIFIRLLKLVSLPIIFFSLIATLSGMSGMGDVKVMGGKVLKFTLLTTFVAAAMALLLYTSFDPAHQASLAASRSGQELEVVSYWNYLLSIIPSSFIEPFYNGNVMGALFLALLMSAAILSLGQDHKETLHKLFDSLFAAVMKMTSFILKLMPLAVWAFVTLFVRDFQNQDMLQGLVVYLVCVLLANVIQAGVILPLFLKSKGIPPLKALKAMWPALTIAFFAKSSSAALPSAVKCAEQRLGVNGKVARFSMPLCISVNMNACAAFILITVLFVSQSNGVQFSMLELLSWVLIASIAAIGNAGVPMGCYMLSSAFLAAMNVDLQLMLLILPFYSFIDMLESAINVWSDSCVTAMVNHELEQAGELASEQADS
ncbi:dicarboxylate/amino acid:cation symporter [Endozoicomonas euniceicola]|uniref:Dicarboxylate/amino acid:cation symporter n=1 Tax=Endozoicomonas euniceicola TaxID=1234143 RepID=A0ABY6GX94_9GAMM|nr:dicarboxylate/amino acid:cation symporter [Endozoicomonas euniceicola]UYM17399.1 dicarboxylate/amino acid:cation symporter [Endozoicomonas euniceicola]